ncbi:MAG: tRNA (adenosine(37)-N6)-threonylcarbamoyltransferase complex ATPase subunit type 1 TsaE [Candidatus Omnitrophica bacterium]|nr:tRNA (adenosine(37)-N6)-threonylcarbamoyltransferase complex ATPase subunit type 1 TsaE [Candidatus Omnitrophota bacterium]
MKKSIEIQTGSAAETIAFAELFSRRLGPGSVLCLQGSLGSGKTTFVKGLARGLGLERVDQVKSPTFVLMHVYRAKVPLYHFDCYRVNSLEELENIGFEDFVNDPKAITCVEWAEKASSLIPTRAIGIQFEILRGPRRRITIL